MSDNDREILQKISDFIPCSVTKEEEDREGNGETLCEQIRMLMYQRCIGWR